MHEDMGPAAFEDPENSRRDFTESPKPWIVFGQRKKGARIVLKGTGGRPEFKSLLFWVTSKPRLRPGAVTSQVR